ncbi:MAG TPA: alpha/beta fold hydrolase [Longimicrobiaceae bacterium]|nr:alpha/beta fold hydrolase [Longimicrobiaceae bacterium]
MQTDVNGVSLRYDVRGDGEPVLFLHGFPFSGALWEPVLERLGEGVRAIVPDLRGMGGSAATAVAEMEDYAADAAALLELLGETRPVVVVGMSMGGYVALAFARLYPERVRALALVDTRAGPDTAEAARGRHETADRVLREGSGVLADAMAPKLFAPSAPEALRARWREVMAATPRVGAAAALRAMAGRPDSSDTLRDFRRPVLVVVGEEDAVTPPEEARRMAEAAGGAPVEVVPGAGHMTPVEQPEALAAALRRWLVALPPPGVVG